jgi:hypothetical protein
LVQFFRDEGHKRMEESKTLVEDGEEDELGNTGFSGGLHSGLDGFEIDIAEFIEPEVTESDGEFTELEIFEIFVHGGNQGFELAQDPSVNKRKSLDVEFLDVIVEVVGDVGHGEFEGVPDLVHEKTVTDHSLDIHVDVSGLDRVSQKTISEGVSTASGDTFRIVLLSSFDTLVDFGLGEGRGVESFNEVIKSGTFNDIEGIDNVTLTLTHLFSVLISDDVVEIDLLEGKLFVEDQTHKNHLGDPEEQDIVTSFEQVARIEGLEVFIIIGPAERGEGEETRGEPGIEDVIILL